MKTSTAFSIGKPMFYVFVFFWASLSVNAQCPTITDPTPPPICDASGFTFSDLNTFATDNGNGIVWYDVATGGSPFNSNELVSEGVYYADDNSGTCGAREQITVDFQVDATNQNLDAIYCSNENPTIQLYSDDILSSSIPPGGSVEVFTDFDLTMMANGTDPIPVGGAIYYIVFVDNSGCRSQIEIGSTANFEAPDDPTPPSPQLFCSDTTPTVADLDPGTADAFRWYDSLNGSGDPIQPPLPNTAPLVDGATYYVQAMDVFCSSNPIAVTVTIDTPEDPGTSASLDYCIDSVPVSDFNLFDELGGTPDTTGTWTGPLATSNGHLGTVNISGEAVGVYTFTYTVPAAGDCPEASSTVTITIYDNFTSGTPSAANPASFCESGLPTGFDLFTLLDGEDPGGQWTQGTTSTDPVVGSTIDFTGVMPGTYDYTYTQNILPNPCPEESTTVQVIILADPNAGTAVNATICENEIAANSPFDLFTALDGSQDNNSGTWTDAGGNTVTNPIDITTFTEAGSPYQFTYTLSNGTCEDSEDITITILPAPESGNALAPVSFCFEDLADNSPFDLFSLLDGTQDTNGTWYAGPDTSGTAVTNPIDISGLTDGTYDYTYSVPMIGSCSDVDVTVQIIVFPQPNTGNPTPATFCENDVAANSPLDLFGQLAGNDPGGTWTDDDATGALTGSDVDLTVLTIGSYNFTYSITSSDGCSNSSTVIVNILEAPESGTANAPAEFCVAEITAGQTFDLYDLLEGEDQTGTWSDDTPSGALSGNTVTLDGLTTGTYEFTYDVAAIGSCDDVLVTVSIIINDTPAATAPTPQEFCDAATVANLSATGTNLQWYDDATGGTPLADTTALVDGEDYYVTQTDATTGCESSVRTQVIVNIPITPVAGNPGPAVIVCNDSTVDLNTALDGTQDAGGVWQDDDSTGALTGNIFNANGITPGTYDFTYFVAATAPCVDASTTVTITVEQALNPGTDASTNICSDSGTIDLFPLLGGADTGGTWSPALVSGTGVFDPTVDAPGTYTYELVNACGTFSSDVAVTVTQPANAGGDNSGTVCVIDGSFDLTTLLAGNPDTNGTWSPALASGNNIFDPTVDTSGSYTYTVLATAPCTTDASAVLTITVNDTTEPTVVNATPSYCVVNNPTVADLDATVSATGTISWYDDAAMSTLLNATDALIDGEDYYATQTASGCESSQNVMVVVTINDAPTPTLIDATADYCINDNPTIADLTSNIAENSSPDYDVIWYDASTGGNAISSGSTLSNGDTYYAVLLDLNTGCESSVRLQVTPDLTACGTLVIPDGFSPNGDGTNDTFDVDNLEVLYPNFQMEIYNRYGNMVYKGDANSPRFDGTSNQGGGNSELPVGVYYYIFNFNDGVNTARQGRLYLSR
ncbi:gliding motility-associated C-terminal domain-containing protein [Winogradskyella sp. A3E31]|uniref:Ig-like domain-containing protein n=1 Tax=Winogradskyella sp. A3E31 TaxID=3349637 RepID=UPI00398AB0D6